MRHPFGRRPFGVGVALACLIAGGAGAQGDALPPVDTMSCEEMSAEMAVMRAQMAGEADANVEASVAQMQAEMAGQRNAAMAEAAGVGVACIVPGPGLVCQAAQHVQEQRQDARIERQQENMAEFQAEVSAAREASGVDTARLNELGLYFMSAGCRMPAAP